MRKKGAKNLNPVVFNNHGNVLNELKRYDVRENPGSWDGLQPHGNFYDARSGEEGIYSKSGYWED